MLNAPLMVATDPSSYSTDKVLAQKSPGGHPTPDNFTAYQNGTANFYGVIGDNDYIYRGCDHVPSNVPVKASPGPSCQPNTNPSTPQITETPVPSISQPPVSHGC
ncbi:MAG: hypothetical protein FWF36_09335 [Propionibacteriaceae bacterium]|nr:hypothetical protein [Propionibacteriaceae bacterium]